MAPLKLNHAAELIKQLRLHQQHFTVLPPTSHVIKLYTLVHHQYSLSTRCIWSTFQILKECNFLLISDAPATTTVPATIAITTAPPPVVELQVTLQQVFVPALTDPQSTEFKTLSVTITTIVSPRNPDMTIHLCLC